MKLLAILAAVWRLTRDLDRKNSSLCDELKKDYTDFRHVLKQDYADFRKEQRTDYTTLRNDLKAGITELRTELKGGIADSQSELKDDIGLVRKELNALETKVDASIQRQARLEGIILSREGLIDAITDSEPTT